MRRSCMPLSCPRRASVSEREPGPRGHATRCVKHDVALRESYAGSTQVGFTPTCAHLLADLGQARDRCLHPLGQVGLAPVARETRAFLHCDIRRKTNCRRPSANASIPLKMQLNQDLMSVSNFRPKTRAAQTKILHCGSVGTWGGS